MKRRKECIRDERRGEESEGRGVKMVNEKRGVEDRKVEKKEKKIEEKRE